jgi:hypothetical protein
MKPILQELKQVIHDVSMLCRAFAGGAVLLLLLSLLQFLVKVGYSLIIAQCLRPSPSLPR